MNLSFCLIYIFSFLFLPIFLNHMAWDKKNMCSYCVMCMVNTQWNWTKKQNRVLVFSGAHNSVNIYLHMHAYNSRKTDALFILSNCTESSWILSTILLISVIGSTHICILYRTSWLDTMIIFSREPYCKLQVILNYESILITFFHMNITYIYIVHCLFCFSSPKST